MSESFEEALERAARPIRARMVLRRALSGLGLGLLAGAALGGVAYALRFDPRPLVVGVAAAAGAVAGAVVAHTRRLTLHEVSLYLDAKLASSEAISTALAVKDEESAVARFIRDKAEGILQSAPQRGARPSVFSRFHAIVPAGAALSVAVCLVELPPLPPAPPPVPGAELVEEGAVTELDRVIEALERVTPRDAAQEKRIAELREKASNLKEKIKKGTTKRELQSELSELSQGVLAEKLSFGEGDERAGLERALGELGDQSLEGAKQALEDRDLTALDEEMARLANQLEKESRDKARKALEDAAKAAREEGADAVAKSLEKRAEKLAAEGKKADDLKNTAKALEDKLSEQGKADLEKLKQEGDPEAKQRLAEEVKKTLENMTPAEREALIEGLSKQVQAAKDASSKADVKDPSNPSAAPDPEALARLAEQLKSKEGQEELRKNLEKLAQGEQASPDAESQELLRQAQAELDAARKRMAEQGQPGGPPGAAGSGSPDQGAPSPGGSGGPQTKKRGKPTPMSSNKALKSRANTPIRNGKTLPSLKTGRAPSRPGETANRVGTGELGRVGPDEVGGVSRSEVPEEYREQVGRYFEP